MLVVVLVDDDGRICANVVLVAQISVFGAIDVRQADTLTVVQGRKGFGSAGPDRLKALAPDAPRSVKVNHHQVMFV